MHGVYTLQMHGYTQDRNNRFFETKAKKDTEDEYKKMPVSTHAHANTY